jgi:hypothetical protein
LYGTEVGAVEKYSRHTPGMHLRSVSGACRMRFLIHDLRALHLSIFEQPLNIVISSEQTKISFTKKYDLLRFCRKIRKK